MKALEIEFVKGTLHVNGRPASAWVEDVERLEAEKAAAGSDIADAWADALRFRWMCRYPDWHFIEHLCRQTSASTSAEFLAELRRVIDARRSVELDIFFY